MDYKWSCDLGWCHCQKRFSFFGGWRLKIESQIGKEDGWKKKTEWGHWKQDKKQTDIICFEININLRSIHFCFSKVWQCLRSKRSQQCTSRFPVNGSKSQLCTQLPTWHILTARLCLSRYLFLKISTHQKGHPAKKPNKKPHTRQQSVILAFQNQKWFPYDMASQVWNLSGLNNEPTPSALTAGELNAADRVYSWCREHRWLLTEWIRKD